MASSLSRPVRVLLIAVIVLALMELGVRGLASRIPEPLDWYAAKAQRVVHEMELLQDAGMTSDVVFVGTSMVGHAINIQSFESAHPDVDRAHNLALPAAQTTVVRRWLLEEVVPRLQPEHVVWGVSSLDFNGNRANPTIDSYNEARATKPGLIADLDRFLSSALFLSRYRAQLRDPAVLAELFDEPTTEPEDEDLEDLLSAIPPDERNKTKRELRRIERSVLGDWEMGDAEVDAFVDTISALQAMGIEVTVVLIPVPSQYVRAHPDGKTDYHEFRRTVQSLAETEGFEVLNFGRDYKNSAFKDYTHLWNAVAEDFSAELATRMASSE